MGLYRADLNLPGIRFGKIDRFDDNDPVIQQWVAAGALVRLDGPPVVKAVPAPVAEVDGELEVDAPKETAPKAAPAPKVTAPAKPAKVKPKEAPIERKAPVVSSVNPDLGIRFDDEDA